MPRKHRETSPPNSVRSLSATEAKVVLSMEAERAQVVTLAEVRRRAGISAAFARKLTHALVRKAWLQRVRRGVYLLNPSRYGPEPVPETDPLRIGRHLAEPYYFGYATAAELLGLLPQIGRTYYVVTPARVTPSRSGPAEFRVVRCTRDRFFGTRPIARRGQTVVISDLERTVLDCLDRPELSGGIPGVVQVLATAKPRLDWGRIRRYLRRLANRSLTLRLGHLAELVRPDEPLPSSWIESARPKPDEPYVPLGPPREFGRRGPHDRRWHVVRNIPEARLLGEVTIR
jgi:predicted transcriptional regulator of viral defense system